MKEVQVDYNPYKPLTKVTIGEHEVTRDSRLSYMFERRLQEWIEPSKQISLSEQSEPSDGQKGSDGWKGFLKELKDATGEKSVCIRYTGTALDFADLEESVNRNAGVFDHVKLIHANKDSVDEPEKRQQRLKELYEELQRSGIEEFTLDKELNDAFCMAINPEFEIFIIAPMSSGKSTLLNALMGKKLLPTRNQATTAVLTRISDNDSLSEFRVTAWDENEQIVHVRSLEKDKYVIDRQGEAVDHMPVRPKLIDFLNDAKDPDDPEQKKALVSKIELEGPIKALPSDRIHAVFVDTPGGNNAQNEQHRELMQEAISSKDKNMILYVFNARQHSSNDNKMILSAIADEMQKGRDNKQTRDRFLFVDNQMDAVDLPDESYEAFVAEAHDLLRQQNIEDPWYFPISAEVAGLARRKMNGERMKPKDDDTYSSYVRRFGQSARVLWDEETNLYTDVHRLYRYASISERNKAGYDAELDGLAANDPQNTAAPMLIHSGIVALEDTIREYIEKYAICIKISDFYMHFNERLQNLKLKESFYKRCEGDQENYKAVRAALENKEAEQECYEIMHDCTHKIQAIRFDGKEYDKYSNQLEKQLTSITNELYKKGSVLISEEDAKTKIIDFNNKVSETLEKVAKELVRTVNEDVIRKINEIAKEYRNAYLKIRKSGALQIGDLDLTAMREFRKFQAEDAAELAKQYAKQEPVQWEEKKTEERSGLINWIRRKMKNPKGWETKTILHEKTETRVDLEKLFQNEIGEIMTEFSEEMKKAVEDKQKAVEKKKKEMCDKIDDINSTIERIRGEIKEATQTRESLRETVEKNEKNREWLDRFLQEIDGILEI